EHRQCPGPGETGGGQVEGLQAAPVRGQQGIGLLVDVGAMPRFPPRLHSVMLVHRHGSARQARGPGGEGRGPGMASMLKPGALTLAAAPMGNPVEAAVRLMRALGSAELIAAEDTRRLTRLAADLGVEITARVVSYHEHNEAQRTGQ